MRRRTKIVYAHHVGDPAPYLADFGPPFRPEQLDAHLTTLGRHFTFASLGEVLADNEGPGEESPLLAVTFDDGFDLVRTGAADVLEAHGVRATTFILTAMLDNQGLMWRNKLSAIRALRMPHVYLPAYNRLMERAGVPGIADVTELMPAAMHWDMARKDELVDELWAACDMPPLREFLDEHRPYFSREGLRAWRDRGHHVGLHTATHPDCSVLDADGARAEIVEPARALSAELGVGSVVFSYPFGRRCSPAVAPILESVGLLDCALGIRGFSRRGTSPMALERASIEGDMRFSVYGKAFLGVPRQT